MPGRLTPDEAEISNIVLTIRRGHALCPTKAKLEPQPAPDPAPRLSDCVVPLRTGSVMTWSPADSGTWLAAAAFGSLWQKLRHALRQRLGPIPASPVVRPPIAAALRRRQVSRCRSGSTATSGARAGERKSCSQCCRFSFFCLIWSRSNCSGASLTTLLGREPSSP